MGSMSSLAPFMKALLLALVAIMLSVTVVVIVVYKTDEAPERLPTTQPPTAQPTSDPIVDVTCGPVIGRKVSVTSPRDGKTSQCFVFTGIPYAAPPTGNLRWKRPVSLLDDQSSCWSGYYKTNESDVKICPQAYINPVTTKLERVYLNEDCLFLSVRSPNITGRRPVVVWIHGGLLMQEHSDAPGYSPDAEFTVSMDVVTVNINYRLSSLGFLSLQELWSTSDPKSFGNYGFFDQIAALRWIKANIHKFGGDSNLITILGQSAGGTSVVALLSSPLANGLFHRAIALSSLPKWASNRFTADRINKRVFLNSLYSIDPSCALKPVLQCLNDTGVVNLVLANLAYIQNAEDLFQLPTPNESVALYQANIDSIVVPKSPASLSCVNFEVAKTIPVLMSSMAQEPDLNPKKLYLANDTQKMYTETMNRLGGFKMNFQDLFALYPNTSAANVTNHPQNMWETMVSDVRVTCPTNTLVSEFSESKQHTVYRMYIEHAPGSQFFGLPGNAHHEWEVQAVFNFGRRTPFGWLPTSHDLALRDELRRIFKEFAVNGSFSGGWKSYPENHLVIRNKPPYFDVVPEANVNSKQCQYWNDNGFGSFGWQS